MNPKRYYHYTNDTLRNGEPIPAVGEWLVHKGKLLACESGLHASEHPFDALTHAPGNILHQVELGGEILTHGDPVDKVVAQRRKIVKSLDADKLLRQFARRVALDVLPLWKDAPGVVKRYLKTGDESIRAAASAAARAASRAAAEAAAWDASRAAAWAAARDASAAGGVSAAWDASAAAWDAAGAAAGAAARDATTKKYRQWFLEMVQDEFAKAATEGKV